MINLNMLFSIVNHNFPFLAPLIAHLNFSFSTDLDCPAIAQSSGTIVFNLKRLEEVEKYYPRHIFIQFFIFLLLHEIAHFLCQHFSRSRKLLEINPQIPEYVLNLAADAEVNEILKLLSSTLNFLDFPESICEPVTYESLGLDPEGNYFEKAVCELLERGNFGLAPLEKLVIEAEDKEIEWVAQQVMEKFKEFASRIGTSPGNEKFDLFVSKRGFEILANLSNILKNIVFSQYGHFLFYGFPPHPTLYSILKPCKILSPGLAGIKLAVGIVLDTSGSMPEMFIEKALENILGLASSPFRIKIYLVPCDAEAGEIIEDPKPGKISLQGRGGTILWSGVRKLAQRRPDIVIFLTDGYSIWPTDEEIEETFKNSPIPDFIFVILHWANELPPEPPSLKGKVLKTIYIPL